MRDLASELVEEGIRQIQEKGMEGFSARAVAEACHVSCAAPFKHFRGRQEFLAAISEKLDSDLTKEMEEILAEHGHSHKKAHLAMNEAYIRYLCRYPFLMELSFWRTIDQEQDGIRRWKSFLMMAGQFKAYCEEKNIPKEIQSAYYFNFQILAYGCAFVIIRGLLLAGEQPMDRVQELEDRIYENLERTAGVT